MKRAIFITLTLLLFCFVSFAQVKSKQPVAKITKTSPEDPKVIEKLIRDYGRAMSDFSRKGSIDDVMKFYAPNYIEVSDGKESTLSEVRQSWENIGDQINLGSSDRFTVTIDEIGVVKWFGNAAYLTFSFYQKIGREGQVLDTRTGKCTEILTKASGSWLIEHEHCSRLEQEQEQQP